MALNFKVNYTNFEALSLYKRMAKMLQESNSWNIFIELDDYNLNIDNVYPHLIRIHFYGFAGDDKIQAPIVFKISHKGVVSMELYTEIPVSAARIIEGLHALLDDEHLNTCFFLPFGVTSDD